MKINKVIFFQIKDIRSKLIKIIQASIYHFEQKEKLLIKVQDEASLRFVDNLLWKEPSYSFLPHVISDIEIDDYIVITKSDKNVNKASHMFNLCSDIFDVDKSFKIIYDFEDYTSAIKQAFSKKRYEVYKQQDFFIESR